MTRLAMLAVKRSTAERLSSIDRREDVLRPSRRCKPSEATEASRLLITGETHLDGIMEPVDRNR